MLFGLKLNNDIYGPWKEYYLDYERLKKLLKENVILKDSWTDKDESAFVAALDKELEKVYSFQTEEYNSISDSIQNLERVSETPDKFDVKKFQADLEDALVKAQTLDKFARVNFTGFTKIVKKHDRLHAPYSVKPLLNVRLKSLPFHSEDYSPLLYKISALFSFLRENYNVNQSLSKLSSFTNEEDLQFQTYKVWIHPDNLMEVKTTILRHLPVLVYNNNNGGDIDDFEENDPTISSLYFDNKQLDMYNHKLEKNQGSTTLRIRWTGKLVEKPEILVEKKTIDSNNELNDVKFPIKEKYLDSFITGDFGTEKFVKKMQKKGEDSTTIQKYQATVKDFQDLIKNNDLQPTMRTVYQRTAFQIPGDNKVRIVIDSDILFIREDSFDEQRPIRDPTKWHRTDIDSNIADPYSLLRKGEFTKFPYAVMEIKIRNQKSKKNFWVNELLNSHLVKEVPNFSKFIQGISSLFIEDERLQNIPFWYQDLEADIRKDPKQAYEDEKLKLLKIKNDEESMAKFKSILSPASKPVDDAVASGSSDVQPSNEDEDDLDEYSEDDDNTSTKKSVQPKISIPYFNRITSSKLSDEDSEDEEVILPPGIAQPKTYLKNSGPLKIEPKVWLANERTFFRWLHVTALLSSLIYIVSSSMKQLHFEKLSFYMSYVYYLLTIFSGVWAFYIFQKRGKVIQERAGTHLDGIAGPVTIAVVLMVSLAVNFIAGFRALGENKAFVAELDDIHPFNKAVFEKAFGFVGAEGF